MDIAADLSELVDALKAVNQLRSVVTDPADLNAPGVYVRADGLQLALLKGYSVNTSVFLVVPDQGPQRSLTALSELLKAVRPVLDSFGGPSADIQLAGLTLPGSSTALPALIVRQQLDIEDTETE